MEQRINLHSIQEGMALMGQLNQHALLFEQQFQVLSELSPEGLILSGAEEQVNQVLAICYRLLDLRKRGSELNVQLVQELITQAGEGGMDELPCSDGTICISAKGRPVICKSAGQKRYVQAMEQHELCFAIGPAGTGKTFLAVAMAVRYFREHKVNRIILSRPVVEAGEKLGYLPGDLQSKFDPYVRPLIDALFELLGPEAYTRLVEKGQIEISPLAYMRGRTLDDAFIILDEAQNTSPEQMKMFLTRIGFNSRVVVTGDITQIDLPQYQKSGLKTLPPALSKIEACACIELSRKDVVRNPLVQRILEAYDLEEAEASTRRQRYPLARKG